MDAMLPDTGTKCCPHLAHLCEFAACSSKHIMHVAAFMQTDIDTLSDDLKPYGEAMFKIIMEVLTETYIECLMRISELSVQEITRAALPPTDQTEPD